MEKNKIIEVIVIIWFHTFIRFIIMERDWANLPKHLLDSILERLLSSSDYLRFSVVCKPWFGAAKDNQSRHAKKMLSYPEPPMLLFFNDKEDAWSLYDVVGNKVLDVKLRLPKKRFCGSSKGWLVVVEEDFAVTLINPFSKSNGRGERENIVIRLPQLNPPESSMDDPEREDWVERFDYYVVKATITADPILNANECFVVLIYIEQSRMAFIRPNKDTTWTYLPTELFGNADVLQREDEFYAVREHGVLLTFNITSESISDVKLISPGINPTASIRKYLVNSNEKSLLMVERHCDWEDQKNLDKRFADLFRVFKFNFDECMWIEENTLGDVALFIGENLCVSVVASTFAGCKKNCIYYNHDYDFMQTNDLLHDFGVYDMENKSISKPYSKDVMTLLEMTNQRPIWFTPAFQLGTN